MTSTQKTYLDNLLLEERKCICSVLIEREYEDTAEQLELEADLVKINGLFGALNEVELTDG